MTSERRERVWALFDAAADLPLAERSAFLDSACAGDAVLRAEVEDLLSHDAGPAGGDTLLMSPLVRSPPPPAAEEPAAEEPAPAVPGYEVLGQLGRGGMGVVYLARQTALNRLVALKMIRSSGPDWAEDRARFRAEAESVARLQHPHIVQVFEVGEYRGAPYFSLEYCPGGSLKSHLTTSPLPARRAAEVVQALARGVQAAHAKGVIHRDLNPANVLLAEDGTPKVADFGLARRLDDAGRTHTGIVMGTPSYMAPEQAAGESKRVGPAADVYALGAILYECLTGRPPFKAASVMETLRQVTVEDPVRPQLLQPGVPRDLETICLKCLHKEPQRRYASAEELAADLGRYLAGEPVRARRMGPLGRGWRLCRRNPVEALSLLGVALALLLGTAVAWWFALEAGASARRADEKTQEAVAATRRALERAYVADMRLVERSWEDHRIKRMDELLDAQRPEQTGGVDLRGFEWHYWQRQRHVSIPLRGHPTAIRGMCFSPDGGRLASACQDGMIRLWDVRSPKEPILLLRAGEEVRGVCFSPDGRHVVAGGTDHVIRLWDVKSGQATLSLTGHTGIVQDLCYSPDRRRLASSSEDGTVKVWEVGSSREPLTIEGHAGVIRDVRFSPDGSRLVGAAQDQVKVWDALTGKECFTCRGHTSVVYGVCWSQDGKRLFSASGDQSVKVWDALTGKELLTLPGNNGAVFAVRINRDGTRLASGCRDGTVRLWDARTGAAVAIFRGHTDTVLNVDFSPDGSRLASAGLGGGMHLWEVPAGHFPQPGHRSQVTSVAISPDGRLLASAGGDWDPGGNRYVRGELKLWERATGRLLLDHSGPSGVPCVAFSPDGRFLASASGGEVTLWDTTTGAAKARLGEPAGGVLCVAFSPDSRLMACAGFGGTIRVWDVPDRREAFTLAGHTAAVTGLAFSHNGQQLASASFDEFVKVWDVAHREETRTLSANGMVSGLAFSRDGQRLVAGGYFGGVQVWEAATGRLSLTLKGHIGFVTSVAFSPDGSRIAAASEDSTVMLWETKLGQEVLTLKGHTDVIRSVAFSHDGRLLVTGGWDRTVRVWDATPLDEDPGR
jgi:WD40 repeat protein